MAFSTENLQPFLKLTWAWRKGHTAEIRTSPVFLLDNKYIYMAADGGLKGRHIVKNIIHWTEYVMD